MKLFRLIWFKVIYFSSDILGAINEPWLILQELYIYIFLLEMYPEC